VPQRLGLRRCFVKNQMKVLITLARPTSSKDNPVLAYLQRHGPLGLTTPFADGGYMLTNPEISTAFDTPFTNEPYSKISGDFNFIINPYISDFASLPATITDRLWSSVATRCYVEAVTKGHPDRVIACVFLSLICLFPTHLFQQL